MHNSRAESKMKRTGNYELEKTVAENPRGISRMSFLAKGNNEKNKPLLLL